MASVASKVAAASKKRRPRSPTNPFIGLDKDSKRSAFLAEMSVKKYGPGGPSRRGSHAMADAGGCEVRAYWSDHEKLKSTRRSNFYMDFGTLGHTAMAYFYAERIERKPAWLIEFPDRDRALKEDAPGHPEWIRTMNDLMGHYKRFEAGDPWDPLYIEEEFEAKVGELDPDGLDEPPFSIDYEGPCDDVSCKNLDDDGQHVAHKAKKVLSFCSLNDEIVTCRPDLIVRRNGLRWIIDHKFLGGGKKDPERLAIINDQAPDYTYYWQAMVNLWICRKGRCVDAPGEKLDIQGFIFNRVKRNAPFDVSRDLFPMPTRQYQKIPRTIRETVRRSRQLKVKALTAPGTLVAHPWECEGKYTCDYVRVCHTSSLTERDAVIFSEFTKGEE